MERIVPGVGRLRISPRRRRPSSRSRRKARETKAAARLCAAKRRRWERTPRMVIYRSKTSSPRRSSGERTGQGRCSTRSRLTASRNQASTTSVRVPSVTRRAPSSGASHLGFSTPKVPRSGRRRISSSLTGIGRGRRTVVTVHPLGGAHSRPNRKRPDKVSRK